LDKQPSNEVEQKPIALANLEEQICENELETENPSDILDKQSSNEVEQKRIALANLEE
jgi:hypothetical protein